MSLSRTKLAYLIAPIFPAIIFLVAFNLTDRKMIIFTLLFAVPFSYISCFAFGAPLMAFFKKKNSLNAINMTLSGAILGIAAFYIFGFLFAAILDSSRQFLPTLREIFGGALLGIFVALPFCLIAGIPFTNKNKI